MDLDAFLYNLHFDLDAVRPPDLEVDWDDAPLTYKLYRGLPAVQLTAEVPGNEADRRAVGAPALSDISRFLWHTYGLTQLSQSMLDGYGMTLPNPIHTYRRFAPSGGGLYPSELYVYLNVRDVPQGVYHYDAAHHRLVLLREGEYSEYIGKAVGERFDVSACFGVAFVSTMFWKNFFKYHNFAYRLQGLDAGVLMGQLLESARWFGFHSAVCFQFLDQALNHLLGLSGQDESVIAVIPLSVQPAKQWFSHEDGQDGAEGDAGDADVTATELCAGISRVEHKTYQKSKRVLPHPLITEMNRASMLNQLPAAEIGPFVSVPSGSGSVRLPAGKPPEFDFCAVAPRRASPGMDFVLHPVTIETVSELLGGAMSKFAYDSDLSEANQSAVRLCIYGCLYGVDGIPNGAYRYDVKNHTLHELQAGDFRMKLQEGMSMHNVNLSQVPMCLHVVGDINHYKQALGYRGYRIQQMEAGMLVQCLLLCATALGMNGHPLLGFDATLCDELYQLHPLQLTSLIQIPIGHVRPRAQLTASLHDS